MPPRGAGRAPAPAPAPAPAAGRGRGRGRGRGGGADPDLGRGGPDPQESDSDDDDLEVDVDKHPIGIIILSQERVGGIRFKISRDLFKTARNYAHLPDMMTGELYRYVVTRERSIKCLWPDDQSNSTELL